MGKTLLHKVWDAHTVRELPSGQTQLFVGLHLVHEVTSPQAFEMLRERGLTVRFPKRTFATVDHIVPTDLVQRPFVDDLAEEMMDAIEKNAVEFEIPLFNIDDQRQGVVHVIGPELGLTQPGMDHCLRRQPHFDARGFWRGGLWHWHQPSPRRARHPVLGHGSAQGAAD